MKNECSIVRDLLPLYVEDMVSLESRDFISEHINKCPDCRLELESLIGGEQLILSGKEASGSTSAAEPFKKIMRRFYRQFNTLGYALMVFLSFLGFSLLLEDGFSMLYNIVIMPVIGALGCYLVGWRSVYKVPLMLLAVNCLSYFFRLVDYRNFGTEFATTLVFTLVFSVLALLGVAIVVLLRYALKKEDEK